MAFAVADPYRQAIRSGGVALTYTVDATLGGVAIPGASGLTLTGGTVTDTSKPGVRRVANLDFAPMPGLFDALSPVGTELAVTASVRYPSGAKATIPMGVFDVDSERFSEGGGGLSLTAPDKWSLVQRARFILPTSPDVGVPVTSQIASLIRGAFDPTQPVNVTATSQATVTPMVWEKDRDKAILDLAKTIGAWVYFDRYGVATIADVPTTGDTADWLIDASASGVLVELDRERSRSGTYNVAVVSSSAAEGEYFATQYVWDDDPASPTYAGTDPVNGTDAGPFGIVPYFFDTPIIADAPSARAAGRTILARTAGLASQVSLGQVPNPAMDAFDVFDVMPPKERYDIPRVLERHAADTVTHPLTLGSPQQVDARSIRVEEFA